MRTNIAYYMRALHNLFKMEIHIAVICHYMYVSLCQMIKNMALNIIILLIPGLRKPTVNLVIQ